MTGGIGLGFWADFGSLWLGQMVKSFAKISANAKENTLYDYQVMNVLGQRLESWENVREILEKES